MYPLDEVLPLSLLALLAGAETFVDIIAVYTSARSSGRHPDGWGSCDRGLR